MSIESRIVVHSVELPVCACLCPFSSGPQRFRIRSLPSSPCLKHLFFYSSFILKFNAVLSIWALTLAVMSPLKGWEVCLDIGAPYKQLVLGMVVVSWDCCGAAGKNQWGSMGSSLQSWMHVPWTASSFGQHCSPPYTSPGYQPYPVASPPPSLFKLLLIVPPIFTQWASSPPRLLPST